jgi:microcystin-dependent protein
MAGSLSIPNVFSAQSGNVPASEIDDDFIAAKDYVNAREITQGTFAARPAASVSGRYYFATDINGGTLYLDSGVSWSQIAPGVTEATIAPTGAVTQYAGSTEPVGWKFCNGTAISRTTFAALFAVIGTAYGAGDGSTTFNLPNTKGRVPAGFDAANASFDALGETGGAATHAHGMSSHTHTQQGTMTTGIESQSFNQAATAGGTTFALTHTHSVPLSGATSGPSVADTASVSSLSPYLVFNYIIKT